MTDMVIARKRRDVPRLLAMTIHKLDDKERIASIIHLLRHIVNVSEYAL
jgi:hypothetical protein